MPYKNKEDRAAANKRYREKYRGRNPEKESARQREYREKNKEEILDRKKKWYEENPGKVSDYCGKYYGKNQKKITAKGKKYREELPDSYVRTIIKQTHRLDPDLITPELIEYKRLQIQLKRKLKTKQNGTS